MDNRVRITMLGTTCSGKTSYLLGLYGVMQMGVDGFALNVRERNVHLNLSRLWQKLIDAEDAERWPLPTSCEPQILTFDFTYGLKTWMGVDLTDFRGGVISDRSDAAEDVALFREHVHKSDCLFLCLSGEYFARVYDSEDSIRSLARENRISLMNLYLTRINQTREISNESPFPIVILLTKYDLCTHMTRSKVIEIIQKIFNPLFIDNSGWLVTICPVSLGKELAESPNNGEIDPKFLHVPLAFAVYSKLINIFSKTISNDQAKANETQRKMKLIATLGLSNGLDVFLNGQEVSIDI